MCFPHQFIKAPPKKTINLKRTKHACNQKKEQKIQKIYIGSALMPLLSIPFHLDIHDRWAVPPGEEELRSAHN